MNERSLRKRTVSALSWSFIDSIANRFLSAAISILLARALSPDDFGLMGMLAIVIALASLIVEGGLTGALIQKKSATQLDSNTVFYINAGVGVVIAATLYLASPAIAAFYREPALTDVAASLSLLFAIHGFTAVQTALLIKQLRFRELALASVVSVVLSGAIAVYMAMSGYGVWSLVVQQLSLASIKSVCMWLASTWRPQLTFSIESLRGLFSYGWRILVSGALGKSFDNLYSIVVGRVYGATELGFYTRAEMLERIPKQSLSQVVNRVTFPVFASIQDQPERLRTGVRKALTMLVLINFPMMAGLAVTAKPLVIALLTERWLPVVPLLQLLSVVGLIYPMHSVNLSLLQASGRSDLYLRISVIKPVLSVLNIALTWRIGIQAMIVGQIVVSVAAYFLNGRYAHVVVGYGIRRQIRDVMPYAAATIAMASGAWAIGLLAYPSPLLELMAQVLAGCTIYLGICWIFRLEAFTEALRELGARLRPNKPRA